MRVRCVEWETKLDLINKLCLILLRHLWNCGFIVLFEYNTYVSICRSNGNISAGSLEQWEKSWKHELFSDAVDLM